MVSGPVLTQGPHRLTSSPLPEELGRGRAAACLAVSGGACSGSRLGAPTCPTAEARWLLNPAGSALETPGRSAMRSGLGEHTCWLADSALASFAGMVRRVDREAFLLGFGGRQGPSQAAGCHSHCTAVCKAPLVSHTCLRSTGAACPQKSSTAVHEAPSPSDQLHAASKWVPPDASWTGVSLQVGEGLIAIRDVSK